MRALPRPNACAARRLLWPAAAALLVACGGGGDPAPAAGNGNPVTPAVARHSVSLQLGSALGAGEQFEFGLGTQRLTLTQTGTTSAFAQALEEGAAYAVSQLAGPRTCTLSANRSGTLGAAAVLVTADCGAPPASSALAGELRAPVGTQVTLQLNGGADLALTMPAFANGNDPYNALPFTFGTALPDGSAWQVGVLVRPAGQTCSVYKGATGTLPAAGGALKVGCEWTMDRLNRSTNDQALGSFFDSSAPVVGGDAVWGEGRFVAFVSSAIGLGGASGAHRQVFWRDRMTGQTQLVSADANGAEGNGDSFAPAISGDGLTVAFESHASNLVAGDTNGVRDVFVWSAVAAQATALQRASVGPAGVQANAESFEPSLSGNGQVVAFSTAASNLVPGVVGTTTINVVRRELPAATNTLVSLGSVGNGAGVGVGGSKPALSDDGNRLAFWSFSAQLTAGDANGLWDIFVYQHSDASLRRVSLTASGGERNQGSESASRVVAPSISGDGRWVAYASTASNLVAGDTNAAQDVFLVDLDNGLAVSRLSVAGGAQADGDSPVGQGERVALSFDGSWAAFSTGAGNLGPAAGNLVMHHRLSGENRTVTDQAGGVGAPALSRNAAYVVFGAGSALDARFAGSGLFAHFTGLARAWWWLD